MVKGFNRYVGDNEFDEDIKRRVCENYDMYCKVHDSFDEELKVQAMTMEYATEKLDDLYLSFDLDDESVDYIVDYVNYSLYMVYKTKNSKTQDGIEMFGMLTMILLNYGDKHDIYIPAYIYMTHQVMEMYLNRVISSDKSRLENLYNYAKENDVQLHDVVMDFLKMVGIITGEEEDGED